MYYGSDAPVGVGAIVFAVPPPRGLEANLTHSQRCLRFPASDTSLCTSLEALSTWQALLRRPSVSWSTSQRLSPVCCSALQEVAKKHWAKRALADCKNLCFLGVRVEKKSCTSSSGTIPLGLYLITRTSSTRASPGDEPPEDLNPESHPDITGHRFLEVSWEGRASLEPRDAAARLEFGD